MYIKNFVKQLLDLTSMPRGIWMIGFASFLINVSSIIVFTISPSYLKDYLGVTTMGIGFIQGTIDCMAWFIRILSGIISDYLSKRKIIFLFSIGLLFLSRLTFLFAPNFIWFFFAKSLDRLGNGLQATPREALVGDLAPYNKKGACYGLRHSLGVAGSFVGSLLMLLVIHNSSSYYVTLFRVAAIPPALALLILFWQVQDVNFKNNKSTKEKTKLILSHITNLSGDYWYLIGVASLFMLSNYSGAFMILHAENVVANKTIGPIAMIVQNSAAMCAAYPVGYLSDRWGRSHLLAQGFIINSLSGVCFAFAKSVFHILGGALLWGIQIGVTQSLFMAKIAELTTIHARGTAFGIYYVLIGIMVFISNISMGYLSQHFSFSIGFLASTFIAFLAACLILFKKNSVGKQ